MNILLACSAGMSTSLLVTKMQAVAKERGIEGKIWAVSADVVNAHVDEADVLLLGPQVRFLLKKMQKLGEEKGIPVDVIDVVHYGRMNGEAVLDQVDKLLKK